MKKKISLLLFIVMMAIPFGSSSQNIRDILSGLGGKDSTSSNSSGSELLGVLGKLTGADKVGVRDLVGTWKYAGPAVSFQSDNMVQKAGGIAASKTIEKKLEEYYSKAGIQSLVFSVEPDSTFLFQVKSAKLPGSVSHAGDHFEFAFKAVKKVNLGKINGYVARETPTSISLTFDVSKLIVLVDKISSVSGNQTMKSVSALLKSYDGVTVGFELKKE